MSTTRIPFHRPSIGPGERAAVLDVLDSGWLTMGEQTVAFEHATEQATGAAHAVALNSATAALHLALEAIGIGPADEVIVPTYTFAACGEVVQYLGARPRLADVDSRTLNVTAESLAAQLRPATKAVMVVHFGGLMVEMTPILELCAERGIQVIEDAAHALPASRDGRAAGTLGTAGVLSFYATKTVTTGEGGMLLTDDQRIADRVRVMRLHGISRDAWKRYTGSGSWYYEIEDVGFKYNLTDLAAAIGLVQLARAEEMRLARERVAAAYAERLAGGPTGELVELPVPPGPGTVHAWHLYPVRLRPGTKAAERATVIERLGADGIGASVHFIPLHLHPYYRRTFGYKAEDLPVAAAEYEREISLPIYPGLTEGEIDRVCESLTAAVSSRRQGRVSA
jgi:dTDP-4-amino-4,6-dideoxygalactose transaminase